MEGMASPEIRPMEPSELESVVRMWRRSRDDAQPWLEERMGRSPDDDLRHFRDVVAREDDVWIALAAGRLAGLLALRPGHVDHLYVEPALQKRGIGSALLDHAKRLCPGGLALYTHQRNVRARAFYERRGFRAVEFGTSPAPENEPDVRFEWSPGA